MQNSKMLCRWPEKADSLKNILKILGYSNQSIKKSGLKKSQLEKIIKKRESFTIPCSLFNKGIINPTYEGPSLPKLLKETDKYLVVSKPSGIHGHPFSYSEKNNVLSFLREKNKFSFLATNDLQWDRGLLYRLDFETSGLMVLTNDNDLYRKAREGTLLGRKVYMALVEGHYRGGERIVNKISTQGKKIKANKSGREVTIEILDRQFLSNPERTLLKVLLKEGARHQIRFQMSDVGHPIWGDQLYGAKESSSRFGLHCYQYEVGKEIFEDNDFWFAT